MPEEVLVEGSSAIGEDSTPARNDAMKNAYSIAIILLLKNFL
jgi:hypothetical protein